MFDIVSVAGVRAMCPDKLIIQLLHVESVLCICMLVVRG